MKKVSLLLGIVLAIAAFAGVILLGQLMQPPTYDVAVAIKEVPPFTPLTADLVSIDTQSVSPAIAERYVQAAELDALLKSGAVVVENLRPGQPLLREAVASGANAEKVSRLAVAVNDPNVVIVAVPVKTDSLPAVVSGDAVALIYANGNVNAQELVTSTISGPTPTPDPFRVVTGISETVVVTTEVQMPVAKWIANGVVYKLNREVRENPNYGAPGKDNEPRYIEGEIKSIDVVVQRAAVEWITFALANGKVQIGLLPAIVRAQVENDTLPPTQGVTWSDFEQRFFAERGK
jgi:hypothetical protein